MRDYEVFVRETGRVWNQPGFAQTGDHPAVNLHWHDAWAFCEWLTAKAAALKLDVVYRLPTDHEWSCAAGLGLSELPTESPQNKSADSRNKGPMSGAGIGHPRMACSPGNIVTRVFRSFQR
ncbi:MAG: SUMF1/EgtB/PvdO family nonheme iron enzyme [Verrucomicrobiales bacterium]